MRNKSKVATLMIAVLFILGVSGVASAQGRGRGGGVGGGRSSGTGQPSGIGVGRSSDASAGRADTDRGTASNKSNGRSDAGLDRARLASENSHQADKELQAHPGIAQSLHVTANDLRAQYKVALTQNPNLTFGQFVAATRLAHNLGDTHPNITRDAILAGLASGKSIGQTLQDLGLSSREAKDARKRADREFKQSRK